MWLITEIGYPMSLHTWSEALLVPPIVRRLSTEPFMATSDSRNSSMIVGVRL
jgi:hypothetical protein